MARGSVFKKPSGTYALRVDIGADPATGKRRQFQRSGFRTKKKAERRLDELLTEVRSGGSVFGWRGERWLSFLMSGCRGNVIS